MNYYERHLGDYARDTAHLSPLEHGVYTLLLDRYYATEEPIPASQIHRLARARSPEERAAVDAVLEEFFTLDGDAYRNRRADEEIEKARARITTAQVNGRRGGRPKKNPVGFETETNSEPAGFSTGSKMETQKKAHQTPDTKHQIKPLAQRAERSVDSPATFERFWSAYPRHVGKRSAEKAFAKLRPDEALLDVMLAALARQRQSDQWRRDGGQFIPHAATWLNGRRWEDEAGPARSDGAHGAPGGDDDGWLRRAL